jgi:deoxyribose-phosphate aldolase
MSTAGSIESYQQLILHRITELIKISSFFSESHIYQKLPHLYCASGSTFHSLFESHQKGLKSLAHLGWAIDHTLLKADSTKSQIDALCQEAIHNKFFAVCVNGSRVKEALEACRGSDVVVAAVVGFPLGASTQNSKVNEASELLTMGCAEIDMVINIGRVKDRDYLYVYNEISSVAKIVNAHKRVLKVILECSALTKEEIVDTCLISALAGAHFVKTSTGFGSGGAKLEDVKLMKSVVGQSVFVKASGGIKSYKDACDFLLVGASRIGTSAGVALFTPPPSMSPRVPENTTNAIY